MMHPNELIAGKERTTCRHNCCLDFVGRTLLGPNLAISLTLLPRQALKTPAAKIATMLMVIQGAFKTVNNINQ